MTEPTALLALADEQYVLLTTVRRSGIGVPTAVWVVRDGESLLITTSATAGKVKRVRHTPSVTVQACDRVGRPHDGAPVVRAHATVHDDADTRERLEVALSTKYGAQYTAIRAMQKLRGRRANESVVVRLDHRGE